MRWIADDRTNYASTNFAGQSAPRGAPVYYYLADAVRDSVTVTVYQGSQQVAQLRGPGERGIHRALWNMQRRVERTEAEQERLRREAGDEDEELSAAQLERIRFEVSDVSPGAYRVVLSAGGRELTRTLRVMMDDWWMERR